MEDRMDTNQGLQWACICHQIYLILKRYLYVVWSVITSRTSELENVLPDISKATILPDQDIIVVNVVLGNSPRCCQDSIDDYQGQPSPSMAIIKQKPFSM